MTDGREIAKGTGVFMSFRGILFSLIFLGASLSGAEADKNAALERMREARAGTLIRGYLREKQDWKTVRNLMDADGAFRDLKEFEKEIREKDLTQKEFSYTEPQARILALTTKAFQRLWTLSEALRKGEIPPAEQQEVRRRLYKDIVRYGDIEVNRLSTHAGRWTNSAFLIPTIGVNLYFASFSDMKNVEKGQEKDSLVCAANAILKKIAFQAWSQPMRKDETDKNIISPERFRNNTLYVGGNAVGYRPLLESALVLNSPEMVDVVAQVAQASLGITSQTTGDAAFWNEGFTADGAGWGHGRQTLVWGYPIDGATGGLTILKDLKGTPWGKPFHRETAENCMNFIRGSNWYYYKGYLAPLVSRDNFRTSYGKQVRIRTAFMADFLLEHFADSFTPDERKELRAFSAEARKRNIAMKEYGAGGVYSGIRYFYNNDDMICKNDAFYMMLNMASRRCDGLESGSHGFNMFANDGATFFGRKGNEFYELAPVMNPNYFPGVTARILETLKPEANWSGYCSGKDLATGVTDGKEDFAAGFQFEKYNATWKYSEWRKKKRVSDNPRLSGVSAYKSCFRFGDLFVMLSCGITDTENANGGRLATTIEQSVRKSDFAQLDQAGRWFRNNGFVYGILSGEGKSIVETRPMTPEKMHRGNRKTTGALPVFQFWIDHGTSPENASCAYLVSVNGSVPEHYPEILSNSPGVQAVLSPDGQNLGALFFSKEAALETPWGRLTVSAPCALLIQHKKKTLRVTGADAAMNRNLNELSVTLGTRNLTLPLPREPFRGAQANGSVKL